MQSAPRPECVTRVLAMEKVRRGSCRRIRDLTPLRRCPAFRRKRPSRASRHPARVQDSGRHEIAQSAGIQREPSAAARYTKTSYGVDLSEDEARAIRRAFFRHIQGRLRFARVTQLAHDVVSRVAFALARAASCHNIHAPFRGAV